MKSIKQFAAWFFAAGLSVFDVLVILLVMQPLGGALREVFGIWIALPVVVSLALLFSFFSALFEYLTEGWKA